MELPSNAFTPSASSFLLLILSWCLKVYCASLQLILLMKGSPLKHAGKSYLSAVRSMQMALGLPGPQDQPSLNALKRVRMDICRVRLFSWVLLPVLGFPSLLQSWIRCVYIGNLIAQLPNRVVLWAISCTAFFGFFRLGKLLHETVKSFRPATDLTWGDNAVDNPTNPQIVYT